MRVQGTQDLGLQIVAALAEGPRSSRELALRLGRPRDPAFYDHLGDLLEAKLIETDGNSLAFYLPGRKP